MSAGEPINPEVTEQWRKGTGLDIYEGYGQTETVHGPHRKDRAGFREGGGRKTTVLLYPYIV